MLDALGGLLVGVLVAALFMVVGTVWFVAGFFRRRPRPVRNDVMYGGDAGPGAADTGWSGGGRRRGDDDGGSDGGWFGGSDGGSDGGGGGGGGD